MHWHLNNFDFETLQTGLKSLSSKKNGCVRQGQENNEATELKTSVWCCDSHNHPAAAAVLPLMSPSQISTVVIWIYGKLSDGLFPITSKCSISNGKQQTAACAWNNIQL